MILNGFSVNWCRLLIPWKGIWLADLDIDPGVLPIEAAAAAFASAIPGVMVIGTTLLKGTIDPRFTGAFSNFLRVRVVGGGGGWSKPVTAQHFNSPAGVIPSSLIYAATAAQVLEIPPVDAEAKTFAGDFVRFGEAASAVFQERDWHLDLTTGIAQLGVPWVGALPDSVTILDFNPDTQVATLAVSGDDVVTPGMTLADARFGAKTYTIRDVDAAYDGGGSKILAWCGEAPASRLGAAMRNMVSQMVAKLALRAYVYRVVTCAAGKMALQSSDASAPDLTPVTQWTGLGGALAQLTPGASVLVAFSGNAPYVVATDQTPPVKIDAFAPLVTLGSPAGLPLAQAPWVTALQAALLAFAATSSTATTAADIAAAAGTLVTALGNVAPAATLLTKAS